MQKFISPTYGKVSLEEMMIRITDKIKSRPNSEWIIALGTDSQNKGNITTFCSTILVLEKGKGGIYFYIRQIKDRVTEVQYRMLTEAEMSIKLGHTILENFEDLYLTEKFDFYEYNIELEIHCDLGNNGKSRDSISAALGWITAEFGGKITAKIKPDSPAASYVADKHTK